MLPEDTEKLRKPIAIHSALSTKFNNTWSRKNYQGAMLGGRSFVTLLDFRVDPQNHTTSDLF